MFDIIRSKLESDIKLDFVALGYAQINENNSHSSIIIQRQKELFEFHYTGKNVEYKSLSNDYCHKFTATIHPDEVASFIAMCMNIEKNANPKYGFFYSGQSYDKDGNHLSNQKPGEVMTCVGFCLNVLKGFFETDYLKYQDWNKSSIEIPNYLENYCESHSLKIEEVEDSHRRITPLELLTSCFFENIPITKKEIDSKKNEASEILKSKFSN